MFHFKIFITFLCLIIGLQAFAQGAAPQVTTPNIRSKSSHLIFSYLSWNELVDIQSSFAEDNTKHADFFGAALGYEKENIGAKWGTVFEGDFLFGQANIGEPSGSIPYQKNYVKWQGLMGSYRLAFRFNEQVIMTVGPLILGRQVEWPDQPADTEVKSGNPINFGVIADVRFMLSKRLEVRQTLGTLAFKAATLWSLGIGYKF
jgi:hypothetical protein